MDTEYIRQRTRATFLVLWPRCHARHTPGRRRVRCWRPMWHRAGHRYGAVTWTRGTRPSDRAVAALWRGIDAARQWQER